MKYIITVQLLYLTFLPQLVFTQGLVTCNGPECNFCHVVTMIKLVIDWLFGVSVLIAVIVLVYAGFMLVFSRGDVGAVSKGKEMFFNVIIGIFIMLLAWTGIDTLMKFLMGGDFGVWNEIEECGGSFESGMAKQGINLDEESVSIILPSDDGVYGLDGGESVIDAGGGEITSNVSTDSGRVSFAFSSSLAIAQQGHLSRKLAAFQRCIARNADPATYIITSVSDNKIANGSKTWQECAQGGQSAGCAHTSYSCHYGGKNCVGSSYALDIRTSNLNSPQERSLLSAANMCGGWGQNEGNHIHVSIGSSCGCR